MDPARVLPVFFGPRAQEFRQKHRDAVHQLCAASAQGCAVRDLPALQALLEITLQLVAGGLQEEFEAPACALIEWVQGAACEQTADRGLRRLPLLPLLPACLPACLPAPRTLGHSIVPRALSVAYCAAAQADVQAVREAVQHG
jgi:hypothetical protein